MWKINKINNQQMPKLHLTEGLIINNKDKREYMAEKYYLVGKKKK